MLHSLDYAVLITGFNMLAGVLALVVYMSRKSRRRTLQLEQAAILLQDHADNLEQFLSDQGSPEDLKAVLISFSDGLADQGVASDLAEILCNRSSNSQVLSEEAKALMAALEKLRAQRPDLVDAFVRAIGSGIGGAFLRWPRAARSVELMAVHMVADPRNEVMAAAEGARLRSGLRFGMPARAAVA
jgi:hypothetical protein